MGKNPHEVYILLGILIPPSILSTTPFNIEFSHPSFTTLANSSGLPGLNGNSIPFTKLALTFSLINAVIPLSNKLGAIVTTRIPYLAKSMEPRTLTFMTKSKPARSKGSLLRSRILAGLETPAAAMMPPSSLPVSRIHDMLPWTAEAMLEVSETSVWKKRVAGPSSWVSAWARSALRSRIATWAPSLGLRGLTEIEEVTYRRSRGSL